MLFITGIELQHVARLVESGHPISTVSVRSSICNSLSVHVYDYNSTKTNAIFRGKCGMKENISS